MPHAEPTFINARRRGGVFDHIRGMGSKHKGTKWGTLNLVENPVEPATPNFTGPVSDKVPRTIHLCGKVSRPFCAPEPLMLRLERQLSSLEWRGFEGRTRVLTRWRSRHVWHYIFHIMLLFVLLNLIRTGGNLSCGSFTKYEGTLSFCTKQSSAGAPSPAKLIV